MDPINLLVGINLFVAASANLSGAKKGLKSSVTNAVSRPKTYLQKIPPNIAAFVLLLIILGVFKIGTYDPINENDFQSVRIAGLLLYILFSWIQVWSYKSLGNNYSQEILIFKEHQLVTTGSYKLIRHPQYISQLISDLGAGVALMGYLIIPVVLFVELPLFILRAVYEDKLLQKHFGDEFSAYKKRSGFMLPFIG